MLLDSSADPVQQKHRREPASKYAAEHSDPSGSEWHAAIECQQSKKHELQSRSHTLTNAKSDGEYRVGARADH